jgi:cell division protein FtsL
MTKLNILLVVLLIASSLYLVKTSHDARLRFAAIDRAKTEQNKLDSEHKRLEAERQAQATTLNVERKAKERLQMRTVNPALSMYVMDAGVKPAVGAPSSTAAPAPAPAPASVPQPTARP